MNKKLNEVAAMSETAKRVVDMLVARRRNTVYTAFSGLRADLKAKDGKPVDRADFDAAFAAIEKLGVGKVDRSERGVFLGFTWTTPIRELGEALKDPVPAEPATKKEEQPVAPGLKTTVIILRRNKEPQTVQVTESQLKKLG